MKKLILFDIDGTILKLRDHQSTEIFSKIMFEVFGITIDRNSMPDFSGNTDLSILREITGKNNIPWDEVVPRLPEIWDKILDVFKFYCSQSNLELFNGVSDLIIRLAGNKDFQLGLLTGNFKANAYLKLKVFYLDVFFPFGAFGDDEENRNLFPDIAIKRANIHVGEEVFSTSNSIIIGDSHRDIECAKSNSMPVVAVSTGGISVNKLKKLGADYVFEDFNDVTKVIEALSELGN